MRGASVDNAQFGLTSAVHDHSFIIKQVTWMLCYLTMAANAIPYRHETVHQHPKNIPIAIHCPRNKWLISCKELLPKISTCFIHAMFLPPKLPTVETEKKNKLHEPKFRWFTSKLAEGVFAWLERYCQVETLPIACKTFKCAFGGG